VIKGAKSYVQGCERETPSKILDNVSTLDTVRDLDRLRIALGESKLNYFGFSYGTYIGELYAKLFPQNIRTMVLDGVIDPALSITASDQQQAVGFERDLQDFYNWCPTNTTCKTELPKGAKTTLTDLLTQFQHGATVKAKLAAVYGGSTTVNYGVLVTAVIASLYSNQEWPDLAKAISNALHRNGALLAAIAYSYAGLQQNGTYSNMTAANTATNCEDNVVPTTISQYKAIAVKMAKVAPVFGASEAWGTLTCTYWPVHPIAGPAPIVNHSKSTILVIGSTGDPATPYAGAKSVARELGRAELLTRTGSGHTAYLFSSCVRTWTDNYITTQTLPPVGTVCPSN
jgi:pimeloyl-ACP methyl ester carboxylesterase